MNVSAGFTTFTFPCFASSSYCASQKRFHQIFSGNPLIRPLRYTRFFIIFCHTFFFLFNSCCKVILQYAQCVKCFLRCSWTAAMPCPQIWQAESKFVSIQAVILPRQHLVLFDVAVHDIHDVLHRQIVRLAVAIRRTVFVAYPVAVVRIKLPHA